MKKPNNRSVSGEILTITQASERCNLGVSTVRKLAGECGAALKIGRAYRIDITKLLEYVRSFEAV